MSNCLSHHRVVPLQLPWWHASFAAFGIQTWICVPPQLDEMSPTGTCGEIWGDSLRYGEMPDRRLRGEDCSSGRGLQKPAEHRPRASEIARDRPRLSETIRDCPRPLLLHEMCRSRTLSSLLSSLPNSQQTEENS